MTFAKRKNRIAFMSTMTILTASLTACGGSVTAEDIRNQYIDEESVREATDNALDTAYGTYDAVRDGAEDYAGQAYDYATDKAEDARQAAGEFADDASRQAQEFSDNAKETAGNMADGAMQVASDTADTAREAAENQAQDSKDDTEFIFNSIQDEWHGVLDTLTSPWGIGGGLEDGTSKTGTGTVKAMAASSDAAASSYSNKVPEIKAPGFDFSTLGDYSGTTCVTVNGNVPFFGESDITTAAFEEYSELDSLGRCGFAYANICPEIMPKEARGEIGMVKPTGWVQHKYPGIIDEDPPYLENRCHLIAFSLAGENANPKNLITATRHFNVETGMEAYELIVLSYVKKTGNHVLYRVTPYFKGDDLLARGVLMEAKSVEDDGIGFCVFVYNVQPGIGIDYATGENWAL